MSKKKLTELPPGQQLAKRLPVEGESASNPPKIEISEWKLCVSGEVGNPISLNFEEFCRLPLEKVTIDAHCVTGWSKQACEWEGVAFPSLAKLAKPAKSARFVQFIAYSERNHDTSLPLSVCMDEGVLLATSYNGKPLEPEHGFPVRTVSPTRYFYKSLKWLREIRFLKDDVPGYWERNGYSNNADYKREERYVSGNLKPNEAARLRAGGDFKRNGERNLSSIDLRGGSFPGKDVAGVVMNFSNLRETDFRGANFLKADLRECDFTGADLRVANFSEANLCGVCFSGANLGGAVLRRAKLKNAIFHRKGETPPLLDGIDLTGADLKGLPEEQLRFLKDKKVI